MVCPTLNLSLFFNDLARTSVIGLQRASRFNQTSDPACPPQPPGLRERCRCSRRRAPATAAPDGGCYNATCRQASGPAVGASRHSSGTWRGTRSRQPPAASALAFGIQRRTCARIQPSEYHTAVTFFSPQMSSAISRAVLPGPRPASTVTSLSISRTPPPRPFPFRGAGRLATLQKSSRRRTDSGILSPNGCLIDPPRRRGTAPRPGDGSGPPRRHIRS